MNDSDLSLKWLILVLLITCQTGIYKWILTYLWRVGSCLTKCCSFLTAMLFVLSLFGLHLLALLLILCFASSSVQFAGWKMKPGHQWSGRSCFLIKTSYTDEPCMLWIVKVENDKVERFMIIVNVYSKSLVGANTGPVNPKILFSVSLLPLFSHL